jgi:hypothetical protein
VSYARFGYADVYVFMSTTGHLECCGCILGDQWVYGSTQAMVDHLAEHRAAGHSVPDGIEQELWADDQENWVDYPRCDVDGCDKRVTCGSPSDIFGEPTEHRATGYVSACSVAHAQTLGGFADWPRKEGGAP